MRTCYLALAAAIVCTCSQVSAQENSGTPEAPEHPIVLQAARLFDVEAGKIVTPGEVLVEGERIVAAGTSVEHPANAEVINLGDTTLMPGLIDAHVHLFLHPGTAEDLQNRRGVRAAADDSGDAGGKGRSYGGVHSGTRHGDGGRRAGGYGSDAGHQ
jgi:hypothetical protein